MNKKIEKIKDVFYYIEDFVAAIVILSIMYLLITYKLDEAMPIKISNIFSNEEKSITEIINKDLKSEKPDTKKAPEDKISGIKKNADKETNNKELDDKETHNKDDANTQKTDNKKDQTSTTKEEKKPDDNSNTKESDELVDSNLEIDFEIASGSSGVEIALKLEEEGIVDDASAFIARLEEMDLANSLLAGDFKLKKNMSYEELAKILTGR